LHIDAKITGGVSQYNALLLLMVQHKDAFEGLHVNVYDMPNGCSWNGGRINQDITLQERMLKYYNEHEIGFFLGFTNLNILDLNDPVGNQLLEMVASNNPHQKHGVILHNEALRIYVMKNYPDLIRVFSITGHPTSDCLDFPCYYREIEHKYHWIVPKFSHLDRVEDAIEGGMLNPNQYEILINDNCNPSCKFYFEHFASMSQMNNMYRKPWEEAHELSIAVELKPKTKVSGKNLDCQETDLTADQIRDWMDLGVTHFKMAGRDLDRETFNRRILKSLRAIQDARKRTP